MSELKAVNGDPAAVSVGRAISELRQGRIVRIRTGDKTLYCAAVETVAPGILTRLLDEASNRLVITPERAAALGLGAKPVALRVPQGTSGDNLRSACLSPANHATAQQFADVAAEITTENQRGALQLAKLARLLPVLVTNEALSGETPDILDVTVSAISHYGAERAAGIERVSDASVPLRSGVESQFVLFRSGDGAVEHLAIVVNQPDVSQPVLVRLHSSCLTGDLFGSMRCDCGEQLAKALDLLAVDGGVLLYLAQEGRNIGLANKLRAYRLQDQGCDTIEADALLGFRPDERYYDIGAAILRELEINQIRLLTNNPTKVAALEEHGISVKERVALTGTPNPHNEFYLDTKRRAGHLL